ncbi:MAG: hypothetical protein WC525_04990 [Candidatus Thermoplasmatota archaeon]
MSDESYITRFESSLKKHTDINDFFRNAGGYTIIAQTLGRYYILDDYELRPNMYIMVSSPPRMGRRGDLFHYVDIVKNSCFDQFHNAGLSPENRAKKNLEITAHSLDGGSPQGLIDDINQFRDGTNGSVAIQSEEFGKRLEGILNNEGYMSRMDSILCKAYNGQFDYESFSNRQGGARILHPGYYFNIFGGLQKIGKYITNTHFSDIGLGRRFNIRAVDGFYLRDNTIKQPLLGRKVSDLIVSLNKIGGEIGERMKQVDKEFNDNNKKLIVLTYTDEVRDYVNRLDAELDKMAKENDTNPYYLFKQGEADQILKHAMNRCISYKRTEIIMDDIKEAERLTGCGMEDLKEILESTLLPEMEKKRKQNLSAMVRYFKQGKTRREVQQSMYAYGVTNKKPEREFDHLIEELLEQKKIQLIDKGGGKYKVL